MDAEEVKKRVTAIELQKARDGRIDWYDRNAPVWWGSFKEMFTDPVWKGSLLEEYCRKWFGHSEVEMRLFLDLPVSGTELGTRIIEIQPEKEKKADLVLEPKENFRKPLSAAERAKAYRERKRAGK